MVGGARNRDNLLEPEMGFFDYLKGNPKYGEKSILRLNLRHRFLIDDFPEIKGADVLDLAAHDGRWSYALAAAGARSVLGVEGRPELVAQFANYPEAEFKGLVKLEVGDIYDVLRRLVAEARSFDIVTVFGIYYHVMDHYGLLVLIHMLSPKLVIIDGEFMTGNRPIIVLGIEDPSKDLNATAAFVGQNRTVKGVPTRPALELMADSLGYQVRWSDWNAVATEQRVGVSDYYRPGKMRRFTCALRPTWAGNAPGGDNGNQDQRNSRDGSRPQLARKPPGRGRFARVP
jgi:SAM-dependent methyltransferase